MSKYIKLSNMSYSGVSTVKLPTSSGGTATFKDVDEIVMPSGTKTITENGTHDVSNYANAFVNVSQGNFGNMEIGTFVGDGTQNATIPVSSKKNFVVITIEEDYKENLSDYPEHSVINAYYNNLHKIALGIRRYSSNANGTVAGATDYSSQQNWQLPEFNENSIVIKHGIQISTEPFISGKIYKWYAW